MSGVQCKDNGRDRDIGAYWERQFCSMAAGRGFSLTAMQIGRSGSAQWYTLDEKQWNHHVLPDVTVWTCPGQHHEIKHKSPTAYNSYGLEAYRLCALLAFAKETRQDVLYTIHNHALSGGRNAQENSLSHWFTANILSLDGTWAAKAPNGTSWVNGVKQTGILIYYWPATMWAPLDEYWAQ